MTWWLLSWKSTKMQRALKQTLSNSGDHCALDLTSFCLPTLDTMAVIRVDRVWNRDRDWSDLQSLW
jgi:hypothetical protein